MHKVIEDLNWRYATKKFDPERKISDEDFEIIKESLRLVPTSYGLQPMKFLIVEDRDIRKQLKEASFNQTQITDASHLIVLCTYIDVKADHVDDYMKTISTIREVDIDSTNSFGDYIKKSLLELTLEEKSLWNSKQAYIALGILLQTCAALRIDSTPMEGFEPDKFNNILGLNDKNLTATLVCPVGYRAEDDQAQFRKKVRKLQYDLFETI